MKDLLRHLLEEVLFESVRGLTAFIFFLTTELNHDEGEKKIGKKPAFGRMEPTASVRSAAFLISAVCLLFLLEKGCSRVGGVTAKICYLWFVL